MRTNVTALPIRLAASLCLSSALTFGASWSGTLVDSQCFDAEERNVNPTDTLTHVDLDQNSEICYCSPSAKTKSFALVQSDGVSFKLDTAGNAEVAELVRQTAKKSPLAVTITGETNKSAIKVDTISNSSR